MTPTTKPAEHTKEPDPRPFNFYATQEKCRVRFVKPMDKIMGNWFLCENEEGKQWYIPFDELRAALSNLTPATEKQG